MIRLSDTIEIRASPERIFDWLVHLPEHYTDWHPDHVACTPESPGLLRPGSRLRVEERLHGRRHVLRLTVTRAIRPYRIDYRGRGVRGAFRMKPTATGTAFTAELALGTNAPLLGRLVDALLLRFYRDRLDAMLRHMEEESVRLRRILEGARVREHG